MPITSLTQDPAALTLTVTGEYAVPIERLWQAWTDPRQIEKFWGPPMWPATFLRHDVMAGGRSLYFMTGPEGEKSFGYWEFTEVVPQRSFTVLDGFADANGEPQPGMPGTRMTVTFESTTTGSSFTAVSSFDSLEHLEQLVAMGMVEGLQEALGQMQAVLDDLSAFAAGQGTDLMMLDDTRVRVSRVIAGTVDQVWKAHHDADLMKTWMLGPDGWSMPVCEPATAVGDTFQYEWAEDDGPATFGFEGDVVESQPPHRSVTTERMMGVEGPGTVNEMTLRPVDGGTLLVVTITYPSKDLRDQIIATGMVDGMEASYVRMEQTALV